MSFFIPKNYRSTLTLRETELAIKLVKETFENMFSSSLNLYRVSAPLFVRKESGTNDVLYNDHENLSFNASNINVEIVHSLSKWKRVALSRYNFQVDEGLYTDMNAVRAYEELDNIHSLYVDQWDWEKIIIKENRNLDYLYEYVNQIYAVLLDTEAIVCANYPEIKKKLPENIFIVTSQQLEDLYPDLNYAQREYEITKEKKAVFISQIGSKLKSGNIHDFRAPDYDDWELNGDLLFWSELLQKEIEISSMGIRIDAKKMKQQLEGFDTSKGYDYTYHKMIQNNELPYTIGGGIGQSRMCMFLLNKAHIGEVQSSVWDNETEQKAQLYGIELL